MNYIKEIKLVYLCLQMQIVHAYSLFWFTVDTSSESNAYIIHNFAISFGESQWLFIYILDVTRNSLATLVTVHD